MKQLRLYQNTDIVNPWKHKTILREGDKIIFYKKDGTVRLSRNDRSLYGCSKDDKCFIGMSGKLVAMSLLSHFGITTDFVGEDEFVEIYKLRSTVL